MPNRRSHRSKPGISRLFSFDYRFDYNKKPKTAYGRPNDPHLPRMKDWGCAEIEQNGKRKNREYIRKIRCLPDEKQRIKLVHPAGVEPVAFRVGEMLG